MGCRVAVNRTQTGLWVTLSLWASSSIAQAACGDGVLDQEGTEECDIADERVADLCREDCRVECTTNILDELTDHTCLHVKAGPYQSASASPYPGPAPIGIGAAHIYYTVIAAKNETGEVVESAVSVTVSSDGETAIYLNESESLSLVDSNGETVPVLFDAPVDSCAFGLRRLLVYALDVANSYVMIFPAGGPAQRSLVFENASSKKYEHSRDVDRDGFGEPEYALKTWCKVDKLGFVRNADDCDDTRASVYPGAPELCDTIDNDCDGSPEESDNQCEVVSDSGEPTEPPTSSSAATPSQGPAAALADAGMDGAGMGGTTSGETEGRSPEPTESAPGRDAAPDVSRAQSTGPDGETTSLGPDSRETRAFNDGGEAKHEPEAASDAERAARENGCGCTVVGERADRNSRGVGGFLALVVLSCGLRRRVRD